MKKEIYIVAGGSGGHITPALAVASQFKKEQILFICSRADLDKKIIADAGYEYQTIFSGKLRRYFSWQNFTDFFSFLWGFWQSFFFLLFKRPKVIFSKGGFVSLPVGLAAFLLQIPLILHESDAQMGLANRILAKVAKKVLTAMPSEKYLHVGTPVRTEIVRAKTEEGEKFLNFKNPKKPMILVIGGSQGALFINKKIAKISHKLEKIANLVIITGAQKKDFKNSDSLRAYEYLSKEFGSVLKSADLVVSRAGANSIAEIAALKKPVILIPLPSAANDHQDKNARFLADKNAAIYLPQAGLQEQKLFKLIESLLADDNQRKKLSVGISGFFEPKAGKKIAREIREYL